MKVGFIALKEVSEPEQIRPAAIRQYLLENKIPFRYIALNFNELNGNNKESGLPILEIAYMLLKKCMLRDDYSITKEKYAKIKIRKLRYVIERIKKKLVAGCTDITIFHAETQLPAYICAILKKEINIPYIFDMRGLLVDESIAFGAHKVIVDYYRGIEETVVNEAFKLIVVSHTMKNYVIDKYDCIPEKIVVIPNASNISSMVAKYKEKMNIIYGGSFNYWERVEDYLETVKILQNDNRCHFYLMGDGSLRKEIIDYINSNYLNICYLGRKKVEDSQKVFANMQIGIAPSTKDIVRKVASPLKIFEYASCGLPIITVDVGEWSDIVKDYDCGIVVSNSDPEAFVEAVKQLKDKKIWEKKSANAKRMIAEKYNWPIVLQPLKKLYHD